MDDRELDGRLTRIQTGIDLILDLEDIRYNKDTGQYEQEEPQEEETKKIKVRKKEEEDE